MQLVFTLEGLGVDLLKGDTVLLPQKDIDLVDDIVPAPGEVSLLGDKHLGVDVGLGGLAVLRVLEHDEHDVVGIQYVSSTILSTIQIYDQYMCD